MEKKNNFKIINKSKNKELFEKYKYKIEECVNDVLRINPDWRFVADIIVEAPYTTTNFVNQETHAGYLEIKPKKFIVRISTDSLRRIEFDGGLDLAITIHHEMAHAFDYYMASTSKFCPTNLQKNHKKYLGEFVLIQGWKFWTEFFAYYQTFKVFYNKRNYPTIMQIVKGYEKLQEEYQIMKPYLENKPKAARLQAHKFIDDIKSFIYAFVIHLAGSIAGKGKYYQYCEKTMQQKNFQDVIKIRNKLYKKIQPLFINPYGKGFFKKIFRLGDELIASIYVKFGIEPIKHKGYAAFAFFVDKQ